MSEPRSGDRIINTVALSGMVVALLAPWVNGALSWVEAHTLYVRFSEDYRQTLEGFVSLALPVLVAKLHMRSIAQADAGDPRILDHVFDPPDPPAA